MTKKKKRKQSFIDAHALLVITIIAILILTGLVMTWLNVSNYSEKTVIQGKLEGYVKNLEDGTTTLIFNTGNATYYFLDTFDSQINGTWQLVNHFNIFGSMVGQDLIRAN